MHKTMLYVNMLYVIVFSYRYHIICYIINIHALLCNFYQIIIFISNINLQRNSHRSRQSQIHQRSSRRIFLHTRDSVGSRTRWVPSCLWYPNLPRGTSSSSSNSTGFFWDFLLNFKNKEFLLLKIQFVKWYFEH